MSETIPPRVRGKACHLTSVHPAFDVRIFEKECASLAGAGYAVVLVAPHPCDEVVKGIQIRGVRQAGGRLARMTLTAWRVFRQGLREDARVYHIHDPELLPWAGLLRLMGKHVIYDMHENVPAQIRSKHWLPAALRLPVSLIFSAAQRLLMWGLPVIFAEKSYAADYGWVTTSAIILNLPLVDRLAVLSSERCETPTAGYIGIVSELRGSFVTLEALHLLDQEGLHVGWECIGPSHTPGHLAELERRAAEYNLSGTHIRGYLTPDQGWAAVARCGFGLAILHPAPNYLESYPTKLFEYMALGIPVIASRFPLIEEVVNETGCGLCVDPLDAVQVARAIRWLVEHPQEAEAMGQRGREASLARYRWDVEAGKLLDFYAQVSG